jgi:uncharacterized protein
MSLIVPRRAVLAGLGASVGSLLSRRARASVCPPLIADPAGLLDLPAGFAYTVLETSGDPMDDGYVVPGRPDGMGLFDLGNGTLALMRNHELLPVSMAGPYAAGAAPPEAYDPAGMGAVTRLVVDAATYARVSSNLVLCGTNFNCAGGVSPSGWISCEENVATGHGFAFLCDPFAATVQPPVRLAWMGRFNHEAAAHDDVTDDYYLTEDRNNGCLYRSTLVNGARVLQAMEVVGMPNFDTTTMLAGDVVAVGWLDLANPVPNRDKLRYMAAMLGAAEVHRGEGIVAEGGQRFTICATAGGPIGRGQLLRFDAVTQTLECVAVSTDPLVLDMPDNVTVAPSGQIFFGENGGQTNFVRALTSIGDFCDVAHQASGTSEISGLCFSPGGDALFCNLQQDGLTVVITGPFADFDV